MNTRLILHITAPVIATSLSLLGLGAGAAWYTHQLHENLSADLRTNISGMRAGEELEILVREMRIQLVYFAANKGDARYLKAIPDLQKEFEDWLHQAERCSLTPRKGDLIAQARRSYERLREDLAQLTDKPWSESQANSVHNVITVLKTEIQDPAHTFLDINEHEVEESMSSNQVFANRLAYGLLLLGVCGSTAGLLAGFALARGISRRLIQLSVPIRNAAGQLDEVVGPITFDANADLEQIETVLHQIPERIGAIIDRLRESERQVLQAEQLASVGQMAAGMAHELRNPLTSMKILVQAAMAAEGSNPCLSGRDLIVLEEEITRLERLVQSFLEFARPPRIEKRILAVGGQIEQVVRLLAGRAALTGTRIDFSTRREPILAALDAGQFRQVLLNLLVNAMDAGGAGGAIEIRLENGSAGWLTIRVADRGCGLPANLGPRIFSPFVTTKETGLGLGLSVCKRIVEGHNGVISAADRPGGGAEFTVKLPLAV